MRRLVLAAFAAAVAVDARAVPTTAEGWYRPKQYATEPAYATWTQRGQTYECAVDEDGNIEWGENAPNDYGLREALRVALKAEVNVSRQAEEIRTLAENLAAIDWDEKDAEIKDPTTGATASGSVEKTVERIVLSAPGILDGAKPDGVSVVTNGQGLLALANLPGKGEDGLVPTWNGSSLDWTRFEIFADDRSINTNKSGEVEVKGWGSQDGCGETLSHLLTDRDAGSERGKHEVLCRYGGKNDGAMHYLPIGEVIGSGGSSALVVVGTDGGSAVCTNRLSFASDPNSNVKFTVSDEGNGNVKVTVGVYYK